MPTYSVLRIRFGMVTHEDPLVILKRTLDEVSAKHPLRRLVSVVPSIYFGDNLGEVGLVWEVE